MRRGLDWLGPVGSLFTCDPDQYAGERDSVQPDILTMDKGIASGFPLSAIATSRGGLRVRSRHAWGHVRQERAFLRGRGGDAEGQSYTNNCPSHLE